MAHSRWRRCRKGEVVFGVKPDLGQVFAVGAAVGFEAVGRPINGEFAPAQGVFPLLGGAGFGPRLVRDCDNRGMQLPQGFRTHQGRAALAFAGIPAGPGGEIEDGHMGDPGGSEY